MNKILKRLAALTMVSAMSLSLVACGSNTDAESTLSTDEDANQPYELQMEISQADWDNHRQHIDLATGVTISYVEMGNPDGDPLILQHGMTDNTRVWSLSAPYFAAAGYHVYMLDLRGHGYSESPETGMYTVLNYADDIAAFMDAKGIEKADLVGHSLGSMTMQAFMQNYPTKCDDVVLVASVTVTPEALGTYYYDYALTLAEDGHPDDDFMAAWYANPNPVDEEFLSNVMRESQQLSSNSWRCICAGAAAVDLTPFYPYIDSYDIPTMIVHGSLDGFFDDAAQDVLLGHLPDSEYLYYEGIGHNVQYEIPEQFAQDVLKFIAD